MSNIVLWGFPNHTAQSYTTGFSAGGGTTEPAGMTPDKLKTDEPSEIARLTTLDPYFSQWGFDTQNLPLTIDGLALVNHNIADGGQVRFVGWDSNPQVLNLPSTIPPQTVVASTNMTGTVANIDEGISAPDGLSMSPTDTTLPWAVTLRFFSLGGTINTGDDMMAIVIRVRRAFTGAGATSPSTLPIVAARIGSGSIWLGHRPVTVTTAGGQILIFPFKRSEFTDVADCQVRLNFSPGLSASGGQYAVLETVACYYDQVGISSPTHDSGWMTVDSDSRLARIAPSQHTHYVPPTPWTNIVAYAVQVRSDQAIHDPLVTSAGIVPVAAVPSNPVSHVQAGVFPVGQGIKPAIGVRAGRGPMAGLPESVSTDGTTAGGQNYGADAYSFRSIPPLELIVTRDELLLLQDQLGFRKGRSSPFYVAVEPGVALKYQLFSAGWVTLASMSAPRPFGRYKTDGTMKFVVEVSFVEYL